jgi:diguanylate cyclase (GGDEF)-like protein
MGIASIFFSTSTQRLETYDIHELNLNWQTEINHQPYGSIDLPASLNGNADDSFTITNQLNEDFKHKQTLLIRGSLASVFVKLNGETIYQKDFEDNVFNTYTSIFHFIEIPDDSDGKTVEITIISPFNNMSGEINSVFYGSPSGIRDHLLSSYGPKFILSFIWLITSIILLIANLVFFYKKSPQYSYIALLGVFISLWLLTESRILQLIINNDFLIGSLSYLSMAVAPIVVLAFFQSHIFKEDKYLFKGLILLFIINYISIILLHVFQIAAFFETAISTQILIIITIVSSIYKLISTYIKTKEKRYLNYSVVFVTFSIFLFLEILTFILNDFDDTSVYASIGMILVFIILFTFNLIQIIKKIRLSYTQQIYQDIAQTDQLTKAKSRFSFENDSDKLFYRSEANLSLVYFDFNDLKHVNDTLGHLMGDELLYKGFQVINEVFKPYGYSYRIGGDEFACLSIGVTRNKFEYLKELLHQKIEILNKDLPYDISISMGYALQDPKKDQKISDLINRADKDMYLDKKISKKKAQE